MAERKRRGFAGMDLAKQRAIASKGGKAAHQKGTAHQFNSEEARIAGRKGGQAAHLKGTAHEFTSEEARVAGRKGGQAAREKNVSRERPDEGMRETPATSPQTSFPASQPSEVQEKVGPTLEAPDRTSHGHREDQAPVPPQLVVSS